MPAYHAIAYDLGAGSGRAILGIFEDGKIRMREIHRFANDPIMVHGHPRWNTYFLHQQIIQGLKLTTHRDHIIPDSLGIDSWGVDFVLLDSTGEMIEQPFCYRGHLTEGAMEQVFEQIPRRELYEKTGIQFMPFNSLFQLWAIKKQFPVLMARADRLLMMPDYLSYRLCGESYAEYTISSTTQMLDAQTQDWNQGLLLKLNLPIDLLEDLIEPGNPLGLLKNSIYGELGIPPVRINAVGAHDTASAVAAIPADSPNWAYISSGTWSLMGIETEYPVINDAAYQFGFTNEGGIGRKIRLLKNINGLWLLQSCKRKWDKKEPVTFETLIDQANLASPFQCFIDPDNPAFHNPPDMEHAIVNSCRESKQDQPKDPASVSRCILESLALKYRYTLDQLKMVVDQPIDVIHVIGGGSKNHLLCQFTANATGLPVVAGPAEATALGNLMVQILAAGLIRNLDELRCVVRNSIETKTYHPTDQADWNNAYDRFSTWIENK